MFSCTRFVQAVALVSKISALFDDVYDQQNMQMAIFVFGNPDHALFHAPKYLISLFHAPKYLTVLQTRTTRCGGSRPSSSSSLTAWPAAATGCAAPSWICIDETLPCMHIRGCARVRRVFFGLSYALSLRMPLCVMHWWTQ